MTSRKKEPTAGEAERGEGKRRENSTGDENEWENTRRKRKEKGDPSSERESRQKTRSDCGGEDNTDPIFSFDIYIACKRNRSRFY